MRDQLGYAFVALVPVGIFGTLLERRFGRCRSCSRSSCPARPARPGRDARDAAAALRLPGLDGDRRQRRGARPPVRLARGRPARARRGEDRENDLLGVYIIAAVLVLLSLTTRRPTSAPPSAARSPAR
jgi:hypothetical protein